MTRTDDDTRQDENAADEATPETAPESEGITADAASTGEADVTDTPATAQATDIPVAADVAADGAVDGAGSSDSDQPEIFEVPLLPLRNTVVFPMTVVPLAAAQPRSLRLIDHVMSGDRTVALVLQHDGELENAGPDDVVRIGSLATIHQMMRVPDGSVRLAVQGVERIRVIEFTGEHPFLKARVQKIPEAPDESVETQALMRNTMELSQRLASLISNVPDELMTAVVNIDDPRHLVFMIASSLRIEPEERQALLEEDSVREKLVRLNAFLTKELDVLELGKKIQTNVQEELGKSQREFYLREQLKAIRKELGEDSETEAEVTELQGKIDESGMPDEARKEAQRELDRLQKLPTAAAEYGVIKTYLDWLTSLPWDKSTEGGIDVADARRILNEDHWGLEKIKDRILEYLAVRKLRQQVEEQVAADGGEKVRQPNREPILCFVGPPGVGKTSLAQSIARALGREMTRMSLGGVRDESEIRGHRRTYVGAMPGRIVQAIRRAGSNDPVFVLDEVDKLGNDWRGDPSSALLEVLDPEQNDSFRDHYLDVAFDLSKVMFIATANVLDTIPAPLRDRMEIIDLSGYTDADKLNIARRYLVPKQIAANGLTGREVAFTDDALTAMIQHYTREAGVRNLEREIGSVGRKLATRIAEGRDLPEAVDRALVREYLGRPRYFYEEAAARTAQPGVSIGVGVNAFGGDIMFIEATRMDGKGSMIVTGQLGDVMKESAQAALSYVRTRASELNVDAEFFKSSDIHLHVPAGATPKDGPSAGTAMTTALISLLSGVPVRDDVGMTGEITLRGQVLPIGGVKEKALAIDRAGLKTFVLPKRNEADLDDLPQELKDSLTFVLASTMDDVIAAAFPAGSVTRAATLEAAVAESHAEPIAVSA